MPLADSLRQAQRTPGVEIVPNGGARSLSRETLVVGAVKEELADWRLPETRPGDD